MANEKYAYLTLMSEHKLTINDLPEGAQTGIDSIKNIELAISMATKKAAKNGKGYEPSEKTKKKIFHFDKWVTNEIMDYLEEKNTNADAPAVSEEQILADIAAEAKLQADAKLVEEAAAAAKLEAEQLEAKRIEDEKVKNERLAADELAKKKLEEETASDIIDFTKGDAIRDELKKLYDDNKRLLNINDLRDTAPRTHAHLFETYKEGELNGTIAGNFEIMETATANEFSINQIG